MFGDNEREGRVTDGTGEACMGTDGAGDVSLPVGISRAVGPRYSTALKLVEFGPGHTLVWKRCPGLCRWFGTGYTSWNLSVSMASRLATGRAKFLFYLM